MVPGGDDRACSAHILLADDDEQVLRATGTLLEYSGYRVTCVEDRGQAIGALDRDSFDLLISDIHMPGNENLEILDHVARRDLLLPVVLFTGHPSLATALRALKLSVIDYLVKPVEPAQLLDAAQRGVEKGNALRAVRRAEQVTSEWAQWLAQMRSVLSLPGAPRVDLAPLGPGPRGALSALSTDELETLSKRERELVESFAKSPAIPEVARDLGISPHTVRSHLKSVFRKLGVDSQVALLAKLHG